MKCENRFYAEDSLILKVYEWEFFDLALGNEELLIDIEESGR